MAKANLVIDQGTDFSKELTVTDDAGSVVNLTGYHKLLHMVDMYMMLK